MSENVITKTVHCSNCDAIRAVRITVPWQDDICTHCGQTVSDCG